MIPGAESRPRPRKRRPEFFEQMMSHRLLSREESNELIRRAQDGDLGARNEVVRCNVRLAFDVARKLAWCWPKTDLVELTQVGCEGLIKAVERFDVARGYRFSTYATWWIRQSIRRYAENTRGLLRIPNYAFDHITRAQRRADKIRDEEGIELPLEAVAEQVGSTPETIRFATNALRSVSLDGLRGASHEHGNDKDATLGDLIEAEPDLQHRAEVAEAFEEVADLMERLDRRTREVLRLRFGLGGTRRRTLNQTAEMYGLSRERVRQIQNEGLRKLRKWLGEP